MRSLRTSWVFASLGSNLPWAQIFFKYLGTSLCGPMALRLRLVALLCTYMSKCSLRSLINSSNRTSVYKPEFLFVLLHVGSVKILLGLNYCAPKATSKGKFWQDVKDALASIDKPSDHTILMGNFNINWQINGFKRSTLVNFLHDFNLERIPFGPTHHRGDSHTTIDYICMFSSPRSLLKCHCQ